MLSIKRKYSCHDLKWITQCHIGDIRNSCDIISLYSNPSIALHILFTLFYWWWIYESNIYILKSHMPCIYSKQYYIIPDSFDVMNKLLIYTVRQKISCRRHCLLFPCMNDIECWSHSHKVMIQQSYSGYDKLTIVFMWNLK